MTTTRVGVIGVGRLGSAHARILSEIAGCRLVGVSDVNRSRAVEVADRLGVEALEPDELFGASEAVIVAVTTSAHHSVASQALESGCHALVEKPLTSTLEEADDLIEVAARHGRFLAVGHVERFNAAIRSNWRR